MKTVLFVREGETVARTQHKRINRLQPGWEFAIATGDDGEFGEWQIKDLAERLAKNRLALSRSRYYPQVATFP